MPANSDKSTDKSDEEKVLLSLDKAISDFAKFQMPKEKIKKKTGIATTKNIKQIKVTKKDLQKKDIINKDLNEKSEEKAEVFVSKSFKQNKSKDKNSKISKYYRRHFAAFSLVSIMLVLVGMSSYVAYAYVVNNENNLVKNVEKHLVLTTDESPKVYIVQSEKSEIFQNPLFSGIQVGDNVLNYTQAGKIVIYRSSEDKIVNVLNEKHEF